MTNTKGKTCVFTSLRYLQGTEKYTSLTFSLQLVLYWEGAWSG